MKTWPREYARIIFGSAPKKKINVKSFETYLRDTYEVGKLDALEEILKYISKYPDDDREIIAGEIHLMLTETARNLKQRSNLPMKVSLEDTIARTT